MKINGEFHLIIAVISASPLGTMNSVVDSPSKASIENSIVSTTFRTPKRKHHRTCAVRGENDKRIQMESDSHRLLAFDLRIGHWVCAVRSTAGQQLTRAYRGKKEK